MLAAGSDSGSASDASIVVEPSADARPHNTYRVAISNRIRSSGTSGCRQAFGEEIDKYPNFGWYVSLVRMYSPNRTRPGNRVVVA